MDYEKKYKEALDKLQEALAPKGGCDISGLTRRCIEDIFPELKEPEDEKIRKWLLDTITQIPNDSIEWEVINKADVLAWLEKQGEQKSTWSEEDEKKFDFCCDYLNGCQIDWLKSLKEYHEQVEEIQG